MKKASFVTTPSQEFFNNSSNNDNCNDSNNDNNSSNNNIVKSIEWNETWVAWQGMKLAKEQELFFNILIDFELWFYSLNGFAGMRGKEGGGQKSPVTKIEVRTKQWINF